MTALRKVDIERDAYHGLPVLELRVGDAIPTPPFPVRYAMRVGPDLARYLLTFNIDHNRSLRPRNWVRLAADMATGRYLLQPQGLMFDTTGRLFNGQHQLNAVIEAAGIVPGTFVWMVADFGWPSSTAQVIDRGAGRTSADTLRLGGVENPTIVSSAIVAWWQLDRLFGKTTSLSGFAVPSQPEIKAIYEHDPEGWQHSANAGRRTYERLDKGGSPKGWAAVHHHLSNPDSDDPFTHDWSIADEFLDEVGQGSGPVGSPTRVIGSYYLRRPYGDRSKTGDTREFYEIVFRAFNAWRRNRSFAFPRQSGFALTRPKF